MTMWLVLVTLVGCWGCVHGSSGQPLYLTPYLEEGDIQAARTAALVPPLLPAVHSYSGFFTVNPALNSNMFFWYFPAEDAGAPVVVWLQGGPGASSMYGLFYEHGPMAIQNETIVARQHSWNKAAHMIYIDNPVGTGFSHTNSLQGYSRNQTHVGENLYSALFQFYQLFPELLQNELYITGESYAGKYVPALAYTIHNKNAQASIRLNLQGIAMGDALCDPVNMMHFSTYLHQHGLIDDQTREAFATQEDLIRSLIKAEKWLSATEAFAKLIISFYGDNTMFHNATGFTYYYNYLKTENDNAEEDIAKYLNTAKVRDSIHVGNLTYNDRTLVKRFLAEDMTKSVAPWLRTLMENYRVMVYNGQLDIIGAYPLTVGYLKKIDWCGAEAYKKASRRQWRVGGELAGYSKRVAGVEGCKGSLTEVLVRDAGHLVPHDQPAWALDLITRFIHNTDL